MVNVRAKVDPDSTYNTNQSEFSYNVHTNRTHSHTGETVTVAAVKTLNALTHSYTIQLLINMRGKLVGKLRVNLKKAANEFGPIVDPNEAQRVVHNPSRSRAPTRDPASWEKNRQKQALHSGDGKFPTIACSHEAESVICKARLFSDDNLWFVHSLMY